MEIDEALVGALLREQFPRWAALPVRRVRPGGWDNRTFRLGDELLARLPAAESYAAQVAVEQHWLPRLAPPLPVAIPEPVGAGRPGCGYAWPWSIYGWLPGDTADVAALDEAALGSACADFLHALHRVDAADAPAPGARNFWRGAPLARYDREARAAVAALADRIDAARALAIWDRALASAWEAPSVWLHGDLWLTNLLVQNGRLSAVIDWGLMAAGDPACDLALAWRGFGPAGRAAFRAGLALDDACWDRARGWALWKLALTAAGMSGRAAEAPGALAALEGLIADGSRG